MNPAELDIDALLKRLHLANSRRAYTALADRAERERWSYRDYLGLLMAEEIAHRQQTGVQKRTRHARFPFLKTIDDFNFTYQSSLRLTMLGSYLGPDFVTEGRNLILHGKTGRGKTHLAVAIAYRAIQNGFDARFITAAALIDDLSHASERGRFREALAQYTHPHVLVIDEVGYLTYGPDAANVLYHVVNDRYLRKRPMLFTTNKQLRDWGRVLHDDDLARAIVDRALERGRLITLDGPSQRTRHLEIDPFEDPDLQPARISGKRRPEFPEPTPVRWLKVRDGYWRATVDGHECSLRMNDFPDEPLFTVAVEGTSIEIDDAPRTWCIESMTGDREADIVRGKSGRGCG